MSTPYPLGTALSKAFGTRAKYLVCCLVLALAAWVPLHAQITYTQTWNTSGNLGGWTFNSGGVDATGTPCEGANGARRNFPGTSGAFTWTLTSPNIAPPLGSSGQPVTVTFQFKRQGATAFNFMRSAWSTNNATWTNVTHTVSNQACNTYTMVFTPPAGQQVYIRLEAARNSVFFQGAVNYHFDNVQVDQPPPVCPAATTTVVDNCLGGTYSVDVNVSSIGSGGSLAYSLNGVPQTPLPIPAVGTYTVGPIPTAQNMTYTLTNALSGTLCGQVDGTAGSSCPVDLVCGNTLVVEHCYGNNDLRTFTYIAPLGETITLSFIQGTMASGDVIRAYSGTSNMGTPIIELTGNFPLLPPATGVSLGNELFLEIESTASNSCADGQQTSWEFEVKCTPSCQSPDGSVTVNTNCALLNYTLDVEVFFTGDATTTTLWYSVDGGPAQTVPGMMEFDVESIGPFALSSTVNVRLLHESMPACDRNLGNFTRDLVCPPANDLCSAATELFVKTPAQCPGEATSGTTFDAGTEIAPPGCDGTGVIHDVWYRFNSGFNQSPILISIAGGTIGHWGVEVYTACGGTLVGCVPGSPAGVNLTNPLAYTDYWVRVFTNETLGAQGSFTICVSATPQVSSCGSVIQDPGGAGNYGANANVTTTYCPTNPGEALTITFTEFNTESGFDFVRVYNGPTAASPLLGTFSGTTIPGPFTSTHPSGCLTVNFTSDGSVFRPGYTATLSCCVAPAPTLTLSSNSPVCAGSDLQLNCDAGTVFSWTGPNGFASTDQNPVRAAMTAADAGTYSVTARNGVNGCPTTATIAVLVNPAPGPASIAPPAPVACAGEPTVLTASAAASTIAQTLTGGAITINGSGNATPYPSSITASGLPVSGVSVYSVQVNGFGHTYTTDVDMVLVSPTGTAVILMSDVGGGNSISGRNFVFRDGFATMGSGALASGTYRCSSPNGPDNFPAPGPGNLNQTNPLLSAFTGDPNGAWRLFVVDDANGDAGSITSWSITFNYPDQLSWTWGPNTALSGTTGPVVTASPTSTITYTATVQGLSGCTRSAQVTVTVNPLPTVTCGGPYGPYCIDNGTVALTGDPAGGTWSGPGTSGNNFDPAVAGAGSHVLTYTFTDGNGCTSFCTTTVVVNDLPVVDAGSYGPYCSVDPLVALGGSPSGGVWSGPGVSGGDFDPAAGSSTLTYTYTDGNGCVNDDQTSITVNTATIWYADQDSDGFGDAATTQMACTQPGGYVANADDTCPTFFGQNGDACDAGPNFVLGQIVACACVGQQCTTDLTLEFRTDGNGSQITWELRTTGSSILVQSGGGWYPNNATLTDFTCLPDGCYYLRVLDAGGDGIANGGYILRTTVGQHRIVDNRNNGGFGSVSAVVGNGGFCLPLGTDQLIYTSCDKLDWVNDQYIVAAPNAAVSAQWGVGDQTDDGYMFWFFDPNGTYGYAKFRSHATSDGFGPANATRACHARINNWSPNQIPANMLMNVKVRSRVNGVNSNWGPVCRFRIDPVRAACPLTKLMDIPGNQFYSCGVTKTWGGNNRIHARPVDGATQYQFRFVNGEIPGGVVRTTSTYYLNLNWSPALGNGTYEVQVRAFKNGAWCVTSLPWGDVCNVTITGSQAMALPGTGTTAAAELALFPNPNNGDQLTLGLSAVEEGVETVSVDIFDLSGARVVARVVPANDGVVYQQLALSELASGVYMVHITAGGQRYTERLVIAR